MPQQSLLSLIALSLTIPLIASELPLWLRTAQSEIVDQSLIRAIGYNMEREPLIKIERFSIPGPKYIETRVIKKIITGYKVNLSYDIEFATSASIDLCRLEFNKQKQVEFSLNYYPPHQGAALMIDCTVNVDNNQIGEPVCHAQEKQPGMFCYEPIVQP